MVMVSVFLSIEVRRYRIYDVWRSRVRLLEENVFANALDPEGVEHRRWRELLGDDLREPALKTPTIEATHRRLRRVYFPLFGVLLGAWIVRLAVFADSESVVEMAAIGRVSGPVVIGIVAVYYVVLTGLTLWPTGRQARGGLQESENADEWK